MALLAVLLVDIEECGSRWDGPETFIFASGLLFIFVAGELARIGTHHNGLTHSGETCTLRRPTPSVTPIPACDEAAI